MKYVYLLSVLLVGSHALITDVAEDCINYMTLGKEPNHCRSGNLRIMAADSYIPGQEPPVTIGRHPENPKTEQTRDTQKTLHTASSSSSTISPSSLALLISVLFGISYCL
ncbi:hypothetical protein K501DRAFT_273346 [Backusella circina FSU 941]|nr:hypothetical protein K501DRAFT_273346 [Backusella circina FSU 941]